MTNRGVGAWRAGLAPALAAAAALFAAGTHAQSVPPRITARITPDSVMIGDRFTIEIEVDKDMVQVVSFPTLAGGTAIGGTADGSGANAASAGNPDNDGGGADGGAGADSFAQSVECIADLPVDTLSAEGRRLRLRKRYVLAAFDEGSYTFGRAQVLYADKNIIDTLRSDQTLTVAVATFQIDSTSHAVFDIKPQKTLPFRFGEISGYLLWSLAALALAAAAVFFAVRWLHRHGRRFSDMFRPAPALPPHVIAITELERLHNQKLWQNNRHKQYYSALSDILRTYIAGRFGIGAMEMTTDEIIAAMNGIEMPRKNAMDLVAVLRDSDLVKFAKAVPDAAENEDAYHKAYWFVEETKPVESADAGAEAAGAANAAETAGAAGASAELPEADADALPDAAVRIPAAPGAAAKPAETGEKREEDKR